MKIFVKAKPSSREQEIEKIDEENYVVSVKEPPVKGLANRAIIKALAEYFNVPQGNINIVSGWTDRNKVIKIIK